MFFFNFLSPWQLGWMTAEISKPKKAELGSAVDPQYKPRFYFYFHVNSC